MQSLYKELGHISTRKLERKWLAAALMVKISIYVLFLFWSSHIWYIVTGNTCYIFSAIFSCQLLQSGCYNRHVFFIFFRWTNKPQLKTLTNYTLS